MEDKQTLNLFLPFGVNLRDILQHPSITKSDLKLLLRMKGIFVDDTEDEITFPLLTTTLLSPSEFEFIKDRLQTREDRDKSFTRNLPWESTETLINAIPNNFNIQDIVKTTFPRYKIVGNPNFAMVESNPDKIAINFNCETNNYNRTWWRAKNVFEGKVTFEKTKTSDNNLLLQIRIVHTSPETSEVADKIIKVMERHFKDNNHMRSNAVVKKILYEDFNNEERVNFFLSFTSGNDIFNFERASLLDIGPAPEDLPNEIKWMSQGNVKELNINGNNLHEIDFIKNTALHKYIELSQIEIVYKFKYHAAEGACKIDISFPGYFYKKSPNIELVVDINKIELENSYGHVQIGAVRSFLLQEFEKFKSEKYDTMKRQQLTRHYTIS